MESYRSPRIQPPLREGIFEVLLLEYMIALG